MDYACVESNIREGGEVVHNEEILGAAVNANSKKIRLV